MRLPGVPAFFLGAGLALTGSGLVEMLLLAGLRPLTPVAWPGLGMVLGAALGGARALAGGACVLAAYYVLNALAPQRFAEFYSHASNTVAWAAGLALLAGLVLALRSRLRFAEALRLNEQRLRTITDNLPGLVSYIDAAERYSFANRVYEAWLGRPRQAIEGSSVREVWGEEAYRLLKPNIERALRGERVSHEYAYAHGGLERHVLASYVPDTDVSGKVKGFFVLGSDITQLAATAVARKILDAMRAPVRWQDRDLAITTSIGVAHGGTTDDLQSLLGRADAALYEAKAAGRDAVRGVEAGRMP